jgi:hypothetical protein
MRACRNEPEFEQEPKSFGEQVAGDHIFLCDEEDRGCNAETTALNKLDLGTEWCRCEPTHSKSSLEAEYCFSRFAGGKRVGSFYADCSGELKAAAKNLHWFHTASTPCRPKTNSRIERCNKDVKEGARSALLHAGMRPKFWPFASPHYSFSRNIEDAIDGPPSPCKRRFGVDSKGLRIPFGALVHFEPMRNSVSVMSPNTFYGLFLGWKLQPGGSWHDDYLVADLFPFLSNPDAGVIAPMNGPDRFAVHQVTEVILTQAVVADKDAWEVPLKAAFKSSLTSVVQLFIQPDPSPAVDDVAVFANASRAPLEPGKALGKDWLVEVDEVYGWDSGRRSSHLHDIHPDHWRAMSHRDRKMEAVRANCSNNTYHVFHTNARLPVSSLNALARPPELV